MKQKEARHSYNKRKVFVNLFQGFKGLTSGVWSCYWDAKANIAKEFGDYLGTYEIEVGGEKLKSGGIKDGKRRK